MRPQFTGTTILAVKRGSQVALAGDGQITAGDMVVKHRAVKIRTMHHGQVLGGFAGAVADAVTLFERFEANLERYHGQLRRAAIELAKDWRTDRVLRRLDALLVVADKDTLLVISGEGEVIEPDGDVASIGSGAGFALAAAKALLNHTQLSPKDIALHSMKIAADLSIYSNAEISLLTLGDDSEAPSPT